MSENKLNSLQFFEGTPLTFQVPSGDTYTIREQNTDDDEIISSFDIDNQKESDRITNINKFIQAIVIEGPQGKQPLTKIQVLQMKLKDKYHILLKTRIHSIGDTLKFSADCRNKKCDKGKDLKFTEELTQYDNDFKNPEGNGFKYQIKPYLVQGSGEFDEFVISSGMKFRYKYMNGYAELRMIDSAKNNAFSDNTPLYLRELEVWVGNKWQTVTALNFLSKKQGTEVKSRVDKYDAQDILAMECNCPHCKTEWLLPFNALKDFFFPMEI